MKTWVNLRPVYRTSSGPLSATPKRGSISSRLQTYKHSHNALGSFFSSAMQFIFPKPLQLIEHFPRRIRTQVWQKPTDTYGSLPSSARPDDFSPRPFTGTSISFSKENCYCVISLTVGLILFLRRSLGSGPVRLFWRNAFIQFLSRSKWRPCLNTTELMEIFRTMVEVFITTVPYPFERLYQMHLHYVNTRTSFDVSVSCICACEALKQMAYAVRMTIEQFHQWNLNYKETVSFGRS